MRLRHKTTTGIIGETHWNQDHVLTHHTINNASGLVGISSNDGSVQTILLAGNVTFDLLTPFPNEPENMTLILINSASGGHSISFSTYNTFAWFGGVAPVFDTAPSAVNVITLVGTQWYWIADGGPAS